MPIGLMLSLLGTLGQNPPTALPFLSPAFGDHMVLQRDRPNTFWGWTTPGSQVRVSVGGRTGTGIADATGKWMARLNPPKVGGPYTVTVDGPQHVELKDVLVGDVWICSGQSNMEFGLTMANGGAADIAAATDPDLRIDMIPKSVAYQPRAVNPSPWQVCTPDTVVQGGWGGFSAVGYYFGRELRRRLHVPIGLVGTYWGGTIAEAWTSKQGLLPLGDFNQKLAQIEAIQNGPKLPYPQLVDSWIAANDPGSKPEANWQAPNFDDGGWQPVDMPANFDAIGLSQFDGVVWYRREITLPDSLPAGPATLSLGQVDDIDTTWINGVPVGSTYAYSDTRNYTIPAGALRPGRNVLTIRVLDTGGGGGFTSSADQLFLQVGDQKIPLGGSWKYQVGADVAKSSPLPPRPDGDNPNQPTVLYNGMVYPIVPLAVKGAIWYQGESNADRAYQYRRLLPAMIGDWRRSFGQGNFPFLIVQLANFTARLPQPAPSDWAELREAQAMTARDVPNSGLAVTIDIGNPDDIHPKDKLDVGLRLALAALHVAYGQRLAYSGPTYKSFHREGAAIRVDFDHADQGLVAKDGQLQGFEIAGSDRKFYWADAKIEGRSVVVSSPQVPNPVAVRYAWANNPAATLYNGANLPAVPFRTDDWPGITVGRKG